VYHRNPNHVSREQALRSQRSAYWIPNVQVGRRNSDNRPVLFVHLLNPVDIFAAKPVVVVYLVPVKYKFT
jgi:hypothetical protein